MDQIIDVDEKNSIQYWKDLSKHYEQKNKELLQELDEYTENSAQLERELEASLGQSEKAQEELTKQNKKIKNDLNLLKSKLERVQREKAHVESELSECIKEKLKQAEYIRELEQKNDDLERGHRVITESVTYVETMLNQAYERNAILESEIDEVESLKINLQRATDEARDLKQELKVFERLPRLRDSKQERLENSRDTTKGKHFDIVETETQPHDMNSSEINGNPLSPRVTALNIVGELLRKVGLEKFVCDNCNKVRCTCSIQKIYPTVTPQNNSVETPAKESVLSSTSLSDDDDKIELRRSTDRLQSRLSDLAMCGGSETSRKRTDERNGKLRQSFLSKSREGLGNIFRASVRRPPYSRQFSRESN